MRIDSRLADLSLSMRRLTALLWVASPFSAFLVWL